MLTAWEGLTADRAATAGGCSKGAFAVRLHRARRRLECELARLEDRRPTSAPEVEPVEAS